MISVRWSARHAYGGDDFGPEFASNEETIFIRDSAGLAELARANGMGEQADLLDPDPIPF